MLSNTLLMVGYCAMSTPNLCAPYLPEMSVSRPSTSPEGLCLRIHLHGGHQTNIRDRDLVSVTELPGPRRSELLVRREAIRDQPSCPVC